VTCNGFFFILTDVLSFNKVALEIDKNGRITGFESLSSSKILPIFEPHLKILKANTDKIQSLL
jgi:uncharacterized protein YuzE